MSNSIARKRDQELALDAERRLMNEALVRLDQSSVRRQATKRAPGRLVFGLDLTQSREHSLRQARRATAAMFEAIGTIGSLSVQLIYFRGESECQKGEWHSDPEPLIKQIQRLSCESGRTKIGKLLQLALVEEGLSGVVYVGDHCEEEEHKMCQLAEEMKSRSVPLFVFHECRDHDEASLAAKPTFKRMTAITGGVYVEFKPDSGEILKELLMMIAAHSTAGKEAVERLALPHTTEAKNLKRLLLTSG